MSPLFNDTDDDVTLKSRRSAAEDQGYGQRRGSEVDEGKVDREVTLNTGIVLVLFFALALLCAVFFGFGYSMGRKSVPPPVAAEPDTTTPAISSASSPKPSPGSPASTPVPDYVPTAGAPAEHPPAPVVRTPPLPAAGSPAVSPRSAVATAPAGTDSTAVARPAPVIRVPPATAVPSAIPATPVATGGSTYVQIAAVSHQEDADVLLSALRRRGYAVLTRTDGNDHLIHVQVGPFSNRKDADAMRLKLAGDGYNAIIK